MFAVFATGGKEGGGLGKKPCLISLRKKGEVAKGDWNR